MSEIVTTKMTLADTIAPKSDQINFEDFIAGSQTVKVTGMAMGIPDQPVIIKIADMSGKPMRDFKPCKSMRRVLVACWGLSGKDWLGKEMTLYGDPNVKWAGQSVGGIRISHVSGISEPMKIKMSESRGKRVEYVIKPIVVNKEGNKSNG